MEVLSTCRICMMRGVRMCLIVNSYLQEIYEHLSGTPFQILDGRPLLICYICKAKLKNCYKMRVNCLQSEKYFTELLNNQMIQTPLKYVNSFQIRHPIIHLNLVPPCMEKPDDDVRWVDNSRCVNDNPNTDPSDIDDIQIKEENTEVEDITIVPDNILNTQSEDRFEDDYWCTEDIEYNHTSEASIETNYNVQPAQIKKLCPKTVKVVLNKINLDSIKTNGSVAEKPKIPIVNESQNITSSKPVIEVQFTQNKNKLQIQPVKVPTEEINSNTGKDVPVSATEIVDFSSDPRINAKFYKCHMCDRLFTENDIFLRHIRRHTGEKPYKCDTCEKGFSQKMAFVVHTRLHTGEKPYVCDICKKCFRCKSSIRSHIRVHTRKEVYNCDACNRYFFEGDAYLKHILRHAGEKPYKCDTCEKGFNFKSALVVHTRKHTGEKPYACDICRKCFKSKAGLYLHSFLHTGEKPYKCDICEQRFANKSNLVLHTRKHSGEKPYMCDICGKCYSQKCNLVIHIQSHTGETPYRCVRCGKSFKNKGYFVSHMRKPHTVKRPYRCHKCGRRYIHRTNLLSHMKIHR